MGKSREGTSYYLIKQLVRS